MIAVAVTFPPWLESLRPTHRGQSVNFWTPTNWKMLRLNPGDRVYFMLKSPIRKIGGFGRFVSFKMLSPDQAWDRWGAANGVRDRDELVARVKQFAEKQKATTATVDEIGCMELSDFTPLEADDYFDIEEAGLDFSRNIVKFTYFKDEADTLADLIGTVREAGAFSLVEGEADKTSSERKKRVGQAAFRAAVLEAYGTRCAITGTNVAIILEAAHIQPFIDQRSNHVQNGIALRNDVHRLFDSHLIWIEEDYTVRVHEALRMSPYRKLEGKALRLPQEQAKRPSAVALGLHREQAKRRR